MWESKRAFFSFTVYVVLGAVAWVLFPVACRAQAAEKPVAVDSRIVLQNDLSRISLDPDRGGTCSTWTVKDGSFSFTLPPKMELFSQVFTRDAMEDGGKVLGCVARRLPDQPDRWGIEFVSTLSPSNSDEAVSGLEFIKTVTLHRGGRYVEVQQALGNPTKSVMGGEFGIRQHCMLNPLKGGDEIYLPTTRNVLRVVAGTIGNFYTREGSWEYHPVDGWLANLGAEGSPALVFVFDRDILDSFYANTRTGIFGWFVDCCLLDPGASVSASYVMIPVRGFPTVTHASRRLIAGIDVKVSQDSVAITHHLAGSLSPLGGVTIASTVYGVRSKRSIPLAKISLSDVGLDPSSESVTWNQPQSEPLVIRVRVSGKDWDEAYESYYEGEFKPTIYPGYPYKPEYTRLKASAKNANESHN